MTLQQFYIEILQSGMYRVFLLVVQDMTHLDGSVFSDFVDLNTSYTDLTIKHHVIESSSVHKQTWGEDYDIKNLEWIEDLLKNSCTPRLNL